MKYKSFDYTTQYAIILGNYIIARRILLGRPIYYYDLAKILFLANVLAIKEEGLLLFPNPIKKGHIVPEITYVNSHFSVKTKPFTETLAPLKKDINLLKISFVDVDLAISESFSRHPLIKRILDATIDATLDLDTYELYKGNEGYLNEFYTLEELENYPLPFELDSYPKAVKESSMKFTPNNQDISLIPKALELASKVHKHQKRHFANEPYINHCIRVSNTPEVIEEGILAICVALLHDCIEDADYPEEVRERIRKDFPHEVYEACDLLTHDRLKYTYEEYIDKILDSANLIAIVVKYADSLDNSIPTSNMPDDWIKRCKKYRDNALHYLATYQEHHRKSSSDSRFIGRLL